MKTRALGLGIVLLAFALRLIALNTRPVWYDEAFAIFLAEQDLAAIAVGTAADTMPPLYYTLLHFWMPLVGASPFALRMLSVALSLMIVALMFAIGKRVAGARAGLFSALFAALAPLQIYHAQEMRMYAPLALGALLYLYGLLRGQSRRRFSFGLIALGAAIALYSHNLAFATLLAANVYFALRREWRALANLVAAQCVGALFFAPWLVFLPTQIAKIQRAFWTQPPGIADVLQMLIVFTAYLPLPDIFLAGSLFVTLAIFVLALLELARYFRHGAPRPLGLIVACAFFPPLLAFILSYVMRPVFVPRGVIAASLAYYALLATVSARASRAGRIAIIALAGMIACATLPFFYSSWGEWRRAPFSETDAWLRSQMHPGDVILHDNKLSFFPMRYYDRALQQDFLPDPSGSSNDTLAFASQEALRIFAASLDDATAGKSRVWFVIFQQAQAQASEEGRAHPNLAWLDEHFRRLTVEQIGDLNIYLFAR